MKTISYRTRGVCSARIDVAIRGTTVENVKFHGGCARSEEHTSELQSR